MKTLIKKVADHFGWEVSWRGARRKVPDRRINDRTYSRIEVDASYAPWKDDPAFMALYERIRGFTLVDIYRCFELWSLLPQVAHLDGDILEVGVWRGGTGAILASANKAAERPKTVYLADTFAGVVKSTDKDASYSDGEHADTNSGIVQELLGRLGLDGVTILKGIYPDDFPALAKHSFSFVHIDVDVYLSARHIMESVWPNMPVGGIVVFDDYGFDTCNGIAELVDGYVGLRDRIVLHNLNGHAVLLKTGVAGQPDAQADATAARQE